MLIRAALRDLADMWPQPRVPLRSTLGYFRSSLREDDCENDCEEDNIRPRVPRMPPNSQDPGILLLSYCLPGLLPIDAVRPICDN